MVSSPLTFDFFLTRRVECEQADAYSSMPGTLDKRPLLAIVLLSNKKAKECWCVAGVCQA